jgi:hypothetical protein
MAGISHTQHCLGCKHVTRTTGQSVVVVEKWAALGQDMLDSRKSGRCTQRRALEKDAHELLERAWHEGDAEAL